MKDAVFASTATPGIFSAAKNTKNNDSEEYLDGGEGDTNFNNNNPTYLLITEAIQ